MQGSKTRRLEARKTRLRLEGSKARHIEYSSETLNVNSQISSFMNLYSYLYEIHF